MIYPTKESWIIWVHNRPSVKGTTVPYSHLTDERDDQGTSSVHHVRHYMVSVELTQLMYSHLDLVSRPRSDFERTQLV